MSVSGKIESGDAFGDLGPSSPSRHQLRRQAMEVRDLAQIAVEETIAGGDLDRAMDKLAQIAAILGDRT